MKALNLKQSKPLWQKDVILAPYSTFKIGGPAKLFLEIKSKEDLEEALGYCYEHKISYYILGKGSNTLFDDRGYDGAVLLNHLNGFEKQGDIFEVFSGTSLSYFAQQTAKLGYGGLEYGAGIPGSVGGALFMNAGANGQDMAPIVDAVDYIHQEGFSKTYLRNEIDFKYRWSSFHQMKGCIFSAKLKLYKDPKARDKQIEMIMKRKASQPLKDPSCGCVFRNESGFIVGRVIQDLGLKGTKIGGAEISNKHGNFIINSGGAKAEDVKALVSLIENKIFEEKKVHIEREIRYVPYQGDSYEI